MQWYVRYKGKQNKSKASRGPETLYISSGNEAGNLTAI